MTVQNNNNTTRNHNNNKNKKRNNNMLFSSTTNNKPLRVVTHNVQGLTDPTKQKQLLDTIYLDNINIMGLSETKLNPTASKYIFKNNQHYKAYFNNDSTSPTGSGVRIVIDNSYAKYIQKINGYKGRMIYIDLYMKGRMKLRIIQVYLPASSTGLREYTLDLYNCIEKTIIEASRAKSRIILMGDFNIQYEKYIKYYRRNGNSHWRDSLFTKLNNLQLIDTVSLYHDITPTTPYNTFLPKQHQSSPTRIDYIWISRDLLDETINSNNYNPELYSSDHLGIYISFYTNNLFKQKSIANLKQQKIYKTIFHYDKMNQEKWKEFADMVDLHHQILQLNNMSINNS